MVEQVGSAKLAVVADVAGAGDYHLGDEAMLEANLTSLRRLVPDIRFTVFSRDPAWTSRRYSVDAVATPGSPPDIAVARQAIAGADALLVSGGGNLCATWPEKVRERATLIEMARAAGRPVALVGQTIGPALTAEQRTTLGTALSWASWIGVRDAQSAALVTSLGVLLSRIHLQFDDAFLLEPQTVAGDRVTAWRRDGRPLILVTLDASFGAAGRARSLDAIAAQIDAAAVMLGAALVFVPHVGGEDVPPGHSDVTAGTALRDRLAAPMHALGLWQAREVRWLTGQAALVISTRYHPVVFALAAGVPAVGVHQDEYTRVKIGGAFARAGIDAWSLGVADVERGGLLPLVAEAWHRRGTVRGALERIHADAASLDEQRLRGVCESLGIAVSVEPARETNPSIAPAPGARQNGERTMTDLLTESQWQQFDRDGYLLLGRIVDDQGLTALRQRIDDLMLGRVQYPTVQSQLDTGGRYEDLPDPAQGIGVATLAYRKLQGLEADPLVLEVIRHAFFREACARVYGRHASVSIFRAMLMNKPAGQGTHLPWHQDAGDVWKLDRDPILTSWIALDPATRDNGCVQVIPGSHRLGLLSKNGSTISDAHAAEYCPEDAIVHLEIEAGEAILLHNWMLHRSGINRTNGPRRALSACYMDGRTLNTLTGQRFPIVFGVPEDVDEALPFARQLRRDHTLLMEKTAEIERYAQSLLADNQKRERTRLEMERYIRSLLADNEARERMRVDVERYAKSLEQELSKTAR
jgi:polysaccharide pyruvyl transferase WcaK-like protein/ectoine hydroxylase-related dioxygenase (phytanoyl-CoA dioxygenase family)